MSESPEGVVQTGPAPLFYCEEETAAQLIRERKQKHLIETGHPLAPKRSFTLQELVTMFLAARQGGNPHTVDTDLDALAARMLALALALTWENGGDGGI